jgi:hypothetical protein
VLAGVYEALERENGMTNLDAKDAQDLWAFWAAHRHANKSSRLLLCGTLGRGTVKATKALANYASNKATAMQCRERGDIQSAQTYEAICERIYSELPSELRW